LNGLMMAMTIFMGSFPALARPGERGAGGLYMAEPAEGAPTGIAGLRLIKGRANSPEVL
jgi:hypothetical protein